MKLRQTMGASPADHSVEEGGCGSVTPGVVQPTGNKSKEEEALKAALYQQIGQLKVELDWLKKKWDLVR